MHLLIRGDARSIPLADNSVSCVITSPPYFGLRDYGVVGQLGLEATPSEYIDAMVRVFREARRVLHPSGVCFINIGDSYASGGRGGTSERSETFHGNGYREEMAGRPKKAPDGYKPKDLLGIPWTLALALRDDGWWLRSEIIWAKSNPMPESVRDRPTKAHEQIFLLTKSPAYFWDAEGSKEGSVDRESIEGRRPRKNHALAQIDPNGEGRTRVGFLEGRSNQEGVTYPLRNMRSVWSIPTESYPGSHFATFPRKLVERCVKAGSSERGVCPRCGSPWVRRVERERGTYDGRPRTSPQYDTGAAHGNYAAMQRGIAIATTTLGWAPSCKCGPHEPVPSIVFDPFIGTGTSIVVANAFGRRGVGLDLSAEYLQQAVRRVTRPHAPPKRPARAEVMPLFDRGEPKGGDCPGGDS